MSELSPDERPTSVRLKVLGFLAAMTFVLYLDRLCIGQAAPLIQSELGISDTWMGVVFAAFSLSYVVFEVPTGRWGDRFGSRGVLARIVIWWSCFTALTGAATGLSMLLMIRFLFGAGEAGALPNSARVLKEWFPESTRGRAQGIITTAMMAGGAVAPRISQSLINALGWRWTFASFGILGLTWAALFYAWFRDDPAEHPAVNDAERKLIAEGRSKPADAKLDGGDDVGGSETVHAPIPWRRTLGNANIWLLGVAMLTMSGIYTMLGSWYPKYLQAARGATAGDSSWLSSMVLGAGAAGCLLGGWLTDLLVRVTGSRRWGRTAQAIAGAGLTAASLFLSLRTDSVFLASVLVAVACFGVQIQVPAWWASATQVGGRHVGALFGLMNTVGNVGGIVSPIFLGRFVDGMKERGFTGRAQWDPGLFVYVGVAIVGLVLWCLIDPTRGVDEAGGKGGEAA